MSETYPEFLQLLRKPSNPNIPIASYDMLRWRAADEIVRLRKELGAKMVSDTPRTDARLVQKIMARLADLLDSDQFNNIEAMVLDAGIPYPPLLDAETPKTDAACFIDPMGGEVVNADVARELERELRALRARDGYVLVARADVQAMALYERTAKAQGFVNAPSWDELHDDTRQLYREEAKRKALAAAEKGKVPSSQGQEGET